MKSQNQTSEPARDSITTAEFSRHNSRDELPGPQNSHSTEPETFTFSPQNPRITSPAFKLLWDAGQRPSERYLSEASQADTFPTRRISMQKHVRSADLMSVLAEFNTHSGKYPVLKNGELYSIWGICD